MAFLNEQGLQHLVDKINVRSSKTLPDNAPDGTIIIDPDEDTEIFNVDNINIDVDSALSLTSTNPVQNKVITTHMDDMITQINDSLDIILSDIPTKVSHLENDAGYLTQHQSLDGYAKKTDVNTALADKLGINDTAAAAIKDGAGNTISTTYASKTDVSALLSTKLGVNSTAYAATRDGAGNNIAETYAKKTDISGFVKTVNGTAPDSAGNVTINVSGGGGVSTSTANTWTGKQTFQKMKFNFESYNAPRISGTIDNPSSSVAVYNVQGNFTLDMSVLAGLLSNSDATLFTAYITARGSYTLSITHAGTIKYIGNASDVAITNAGLLLNIMMLKDASGNLTSIVQASKLS